MRALNNFTGNARGRNIFPVGLTFSDIYTDASLDPFFFQFAYTAPVQIKGVSNTFDLNVDSDPTFEGRPQYLSYYLSETKWNLPVDYDISPESFGYTRITPTGAQILGIPNGWWLGFAYEPRDPYGSFGAVVTLKANAGNLAKQYISQFLVSAI